MGRTSTAGQFGHDGRLHYGSLPEARPERKTRHARQSALTSRGAEARCRLCGDRAAYDFAEDGFCDFSKKAFDPRTFRDVELASMTGTIAWQNGKPSIPLLIGQ